MFHFASRNFAIVRLMTAKNCRSLIDKGMCRACNFIVGVELETLRLAGVFIDKTVRCGGEVRYLS